MKFFLRRSLISFVLIALARADGAEQISEDRELKRPATRAKIRVTGCLLWDDEHNDNTKDVGATIRVSRDATTVTVRYLDTTYPIPIASTDLR